MEISLKFLKIVYLLFQVHHKEEVLRILEKRLFNEYWSKARYCPEQPTTSQDIDSLEGALYFRKIEEAKNLAEGQNAKLALLSDNEMGLYE